MHENLKWREWIGLHELYTTGKTSRGIQQNAYIRHLLERRYLSKDVRPNILLAQPSFYKKYEADHLEKYKHYESFLVENDIVNKCSTYTEDDIQSMMLIKENRQTIVNSQDTRRGISSKFFKNSDSKHIENHPGLETAVLKLLEISCFPEQDPKNNQYLCVVMCSAPKAIILCENLAFLKLPWKAKANSIELWYAGGNNLSMLTDIPEDRLSKPIYYSCDWDCDGLQIYQRAKKYIPKMILLYPNAARNPKPIKTPNHNSEWNTVLPLSGLDESLYTLEAIDLINNLINRDEWIEEESNNFEEMLKLNRILQPN